MRRRRCSNEVLALPNSKTRRTASSNMGSLASPSLAALAVLAGFFLRAFEEAVDVFGFALRLPEGGDGGDFFFSYKWRMDALDAAGAGRQIEHIAFAEQAFGAVGIDDGARVDLGGEAEAHAGGDVGLDEAGDDVDAGPLRGEHQVDADGAGHLGEAGDGLFDVGAVEHHQVGELVDDDDDVGQRLLVLRLRRGTRCRGRRAC